MPYIPTIPQKVVHKRAVVRGVSFEKPKVRPQQFELDYDHPLAKGLVFAGLGNASGSVRYNDSSSKLNHGVLTAMEPSSDWVFDSTLNRMALSFDGSDYIVTPTINFQDGDFTIGTWVNVPSTPTSNDTILSSIGGNITTTLYFRESTTKLSAFLRDSASAYDLVQCPTAVVLGNWEYYTIGRVNNKVVISRNGVTTTGSATTSASGNTGYPYWIADDRVWGPRKLIGKLADVAFWSRALNAFELRALADPSNTMLSGLIRPVQGTTKYFRGVTLSDAYTLKPPAVHVSHGKSRPENFTIDLDHPLAKGLVFAGLGQCPGSTRYADASPYCSVGTLTGMIPSTSWIFDGTLGRFVLAFDGSNDIVNCGTFNRLDGTTNRSIAFFGKQKAGGGDYCGAISINSGSDYTGPFIVHGRLDQGAGTQINVGSATVSPILGVSTNVMYHLCFVWNGTNLLFYRNGNYVNSTAASATFSLTNQTMYLGYRERGAQYWSGEMGDMVLHNRALSPSEISLLSDPSNVMLSGLIKPILSRPLPLAINDRHWVGRSSDWHASANWSRSRGGYGRAGVPNENTNVVFDADLPQY